MNRRAIIIYRVDQSDSSNMGVINKLIGQISGFKQNGFKADFIIHRKGQIYLNEEKIRTVSMTFGATYFNVQFYKYLDEIDFSEYDIILVRYGISTPSFIHWIRQIKKSKALILLDMPTYPYLKEWPGIFGRIVLLCDAYFRRKLKRNVDAMLHSGLEKEIFGIPVISLSNGIEVNKVQTRTPSPSSRIHLLALGKWREWHGLDRLIHGLAEYRSNDVILHIVGTGTAIGPLKKLAQKMDLTSQVKFEGILSGALLNQLFDRAHLGIRTLGLHRKNVQIDSSLKHREYTARGLPFIMAGVDADRLHEQDFVLNLPPTDDLISIDELIRFINRLDVTNAIGEMRRYAEKQLSWEVKISLLLQKVSSLDEEIR